MGLPLTDARLSLNAARSTARRTTGFDSPDEATVRSCSLRTMWHLQGKLGVHNRDKYARHAGTRHSSAVSARASFPRRLPFHLPCCTSRVQQGAGWIWSKASFPASFHTSPAVLGRDSNDGGGSINATFTRARLPDSPPRLHHDSNTACAATRADFHHYILRIKALYTVLWLQAVRPLDCRKDLLMVTPETLEAVSAVLNLQYLLSTAGTCMWHLDRVGKASDTLADPSETKIQLPMSHVR